MLKKQFVRNTYKESVGMRPLNVILLVFLSIVIKTAIAAPDIILNITALPPLNTSTQDGFADEVATEAFKRIGYELHTERLPAERGLKSANKGLIDGEMTRVKGLNKTYKNLVRVPEKIMDWEFVAFSYKPISMAQGWSSLSGKLVGHINGWKILEKNIPGDAEVTKVENADELFRLLEKKRTDFVIYEQWGGYYKVNSMSMNQVEKCEPAFAVKEMFIYLHEKHKALVPMLSASLKEMKKDGSYQKLYNKHLTPLKQ